MSWRVTIEGVLDGKSFVQNFYVSAATRDSATDLARSRFSELGADFVEVVETEPTNEIRLKTDEIQESGRIFFD
jgi:hypothetical protein